MGHLLEKRDLTLVRSQDCLIHHRLAVGLHIHQHLVGARMFASGDREIVPVQRFVEHNRVGAFSEGVHQRRGHVPRAGPAVESHGQLTRNVSGYGGVVQVAESSRHRPGRTIAHLAAVDLYRWSESTERTRDEGFVGGVHIG